MSRMYPGDDNMYHPLEIMYRRGDNGSILVCKQKTVYGNYDIEYEIDFSKCLDVNAFGMFKADGTQEQLKVTMSFNHCQMRIKPIQKEEQSKDEQR